jgi:hypothetical protein
MDLERKDSLKQLKKPPQIPKLSIARESPPSTKYEVDFLYKRIGEL